VGVGWERALEAARCEALKRQWKKAVEEGSVETGAPFRQAEQQKERRA
jgi:hypothetical protein